MPLGVSLSALVDNAFFHSLHHHPLRNFISQFDSLPSTFASFASLVDLCVLLSPLLSVHMTSLIFQQVLKVCKNV